MNATTTNTLHPNANLGVPPKPSEVHQRAGVLGQKRNVVMSGSRLYLEHDGKRWVIVKVTAP